MPLLDVRGQPVHYLDSGGDGPAVLFLHGFLMDARMFEPQVEVLAPRWRCLRLDARGFGGTPVEGPFDCWDLADDAVGLLEALGIEAAPFVGMSLGGFVALRAALGRPERVRALVLIDSQAGVDDPATLEGYRQMFEAWMGPEPAEPILEEVAHLILGDDAALRRIWTDRWRELEPSGLRHPVRCLLERDDVRDRLSDIGCPALIVHGEEDRAMSKERAEELDRGLAGSRGIVRVPGAAHAPNLTHPEVVNPALLDFLEEVGGG